MNISQEKKLRKAIEKMLGEYNAISRCRQCGHEMQMRIPDRMPFWDFVCPVCNYFGQDWIRYW